MRPMSTRESAIGISLPELTGMVDQWRLSTIPVAAQGVPPHITLLYPWRTAPLQPADLTAAAAAVAGIAPFTVTFRRVGRFPGALFLFPEPENVLRSLIQRLVKVFPETPPYGGQFGADPTPHLTIAQAATEEELSKLQAEITAGLEPRLPMSFPVHALSIEEEGPDGRWHASATIQLVGS
jgi:2'-5' RNA ligase